MLHRDSSDSKECKPGSRDSNGLYCSELHWQKMAWYTAYLQAFVVQHLHWQTVLRHHAWDYAASQFAHHIYAMQENECPHPAPGLQLH